MVTASTTVAVGLLTGGAALLGQWLNQRSASRQATQARLAALRTERKEAYLEFLESTQRVSRAIENRRREGLHDDEEAAQLTHQMWRQFRKVSLVADGDVAQNAHRLARMFNDAVWENVEPPSDIWAYMDDAIDPFMVAARRSLLDS